MITGVENLNLVLMLTPKKEVSEIPQMLRDFADKMEQDITAWCQFDDNMTDVKNGIEYDFVDKHIKSLVDFADAV